MFGIFEGDKSNDRPKPEEPLIVRGQMLYLFGDHAATARCDVFASSRPRIGDFEFHGKYANSPYATAMLIRADTIGSFV